MTTDVHRWLQEYYGHTLEGSADLKTNACCATGAPPRWLEQPLSNIHPEVMERFYGCGYPVPLALGGATVADLGCGTGRDVYLVSQLVGPGGFVHGVDMTDEQLAVARERVDWHMARFGFAEANVAFHRGFIEDLSPLPIPDGSVDVVISNCVVNLSPDREAVLREVLRILKPGGELYISDVFADRRLPPEVALDPILHAECLGGALYDHDFLVMARRVGFLDPREVERAPIAIQEGEIRDLVGSARFESVTLRLFKLDGLDARCEDYGQVATYRGGLPGSPHRYRLDDHHLFETGRPERVCGNTAAMLRETRLGHWFEVAGERSIHFGAFPCGPTLATQQYEAEPGASSGCCC
jgi:SAM-dependent methyltransferase